MRCYSGFFLASLLTLILLDTIQLNVRADTSEPTSSFGSGTGTGAAATSPNTGSGAQKGLTADIQLIDKHPSQIKISISTSKPQVTVGAGFGITAEIKNISEIPVYLKGKYVTITPPPEIDPNAPEVWWASIPGTQTDSDHWYVDPVRLGPGDSIVALWAGDYKSVQTSLSTDNAEPPKNAELPKSTKLPIDKDKKDKNSSGFFSCIFSMVKASIPMVKASIDDFIRVATFTPGQYDVVLTVIYWPNKSPNASSSSTGNAPHYRITVAHIKVAVVAPEWVILLGAVLGGLIAYILLPNARLKPNEFELLGFISAALLSSIVTILLSRIADTQFFIRITVNDLWGAMAVGFAAAASGSSYLQRFVSPPPTPP